MMLPIKKIICPTDFSEHSYRAFGIAQEFALHFSSELCLMNVVSHVPVPYIPTEAFPASTIASGEFNIEQYEEQLMQAARESLENLARKRISDEVKICTYVAIGEASEEIIRVAKEEKADLIIIATQGLTGWRHIVFGSVAEKVVRLSPCPVLTTRE